MILDYMAKENQLRAESHLPLTVTLMLNTFAHAQILFDAFLPKHSHRLYKLTAQAHASLKIKSTYILRGALSLRMTVSGRCEYTSYFELSDVQLEHERDRER